MFYMKNKQAVKPPTQDPGTKKSQDSEVAKFVKYAVPVFNTSILTISGVVLALGLVTWLVLR